MALKIDPMQNIRLLSGHPRDELLAPAIPGDHSAKIVDLADMLGGISYHAAQGSPTRPRLTSYIFNWLLELPWCQSGNPFHDDPVRRLRVPQKILTANSEGGHLLRSVT